MLRLSMRQKILATLIFVSCISGCASDPNLAGAAKFNAKTLQKGGVIVGGVASANAQLGERQHLQYAALLTQSLREHAPELAVVDNDQVRRQLGASLFGQMLDSYRFSGSASYALMDVLHERFPQSRYVIYVRIEQEQLDHKATPMADGRGHDLQSSRLVMVSMRVYDLFDRQNQVWAAAIGNAAATRKQVFGSFKEEALSKLYPAPPPTETVVQAPIDRLVAKMLVK